MFNVFKANREISKPKTEFKDESTVNKTQSIFQRIEEYSKKIEQGASNPTVLPNNDPNLDQEKPKPNNKLGIIIGIISFIILMLASFIPEIMENEQNLLVCESLEGDITIYYDEETLIRYTANGIIYNLEDQRIIAEDIGVENYIYAFIEWFNENTSGNCIIIERVIDE